MADSKLLGLYAEITQKGFTELKSSIGALKSNVGGASKALQFIKTTALQAGAGVRNAFSGAFAGATRGVDALRAKMTALGSTSFGKAVTASLSSIGAMAGAVGEKLKSAFAPEKTKTKTNTAFGKKVNSGAGKIKSKADSVASTSRNKLLGGAATAGGFAAAFDPGGMQVLIIKAQLAARAVGRIFQPFIVMASQALDKVRQFFQTLSGDQVAAIFNTVLLVGKLLAVGFAFSKIISLASALVPIITSVASVLTLAFTSPLGLLIAGIVALTAAFVYFMNKAKIDKFFDAGKITGKNAPGRSSGPINRSFQANDDLHRNLNTASDTLGGADGKSGKTKQEEMADDVKSISETVKIIANAGKVAGTVVSRLFGSSTPAAAG